MKSTKHLLLFGTSLALSFNLAHAQQASLSSSSISLESATDVPAMMEALESVSPVPFDVTQQSSGTFWSAQHLPGSQTPWPPLPCNGLNLDIWPLGDGSFILDDRQVDYVQIQADADAEAALTAENPLESSGTMMARGALSPLSSSSLASSTNLWLEITSVDLTNQLANVLAHNTSDTTFYQLLSKSNLLQPSWTLGEIIQGTFDTNTTMFDPFYLDGNPTMFFYAQQSDVYVYIADEGDAVEPHGADPGEAGVFSVTVTGATNDLTVHYTISGTAINGVDYSNLSGVVTVSAALGHAEIDVQPLADNLVEGAETVTLTLVPTNTFLIYGSGNSDTGWIFDSSTTVWFETDLDSDAIEPDGPPGVPAQPGSFVVYRSDSRNLFTNLTVYYSISGTASNGVDYSLLSGTVNFAPDIQETNIDISPLADHLPEGIETVKLTLVPTNTYLVDASFSTATNTISDSTTTVSMGDATSVIALEPDGPPGAPGIPNFFSVHRYDTRGIYTNMAVHYVVGGTASNGVDYVFLSGTLNFAAGMTDTNLAVTPLADSMIEGLETVTMTLLDTVTNGYFIDANNVARTNKINDSTTTVGIGGTSTIAIELDGPPGAPAIPTFFSVHRSDTRGIYTNMAVRYVVGGTASNGVDYVLLSGTLNFASGMTDTNIAVTPLSDNVIEGLETVTMSLLATNGCFVDSNNATATNSINDSTTTVLISAGTSAVEPGVTTNLPGQIGSFTVSRTDTRGIFSNLTVRYLISGTASNSIDYSNLTGTVTFAPTATATNIYFQPLADNLLEGDETVILTLVATNGYLINAASAANTIADTLNFMTVTNVSGPIGIDYHAPANSLIVSYNYNAGNPYNFARVYTNPVVSNSVLVTNWSGAHGAGDEVKLATVKTNMSGFTNGDIYFGSGAGIGWVSADGTRSNMNWCVLTNSVVTNALPLRGSLYVDQTGVFSNSLIVVTSEGSSSGSKKGVWRVDAQAHPTLLTNLATAHLEGVITLPNDTNRWGTWAGKIITGDEDFSPNPVIYTIAVNGAVILYDTTNLISGGIHPEDFDIIPTNQNLYCVAFNDGNSSAHTIVKLSKDYFSGYAGDLLITDAGENVPPAKLFVVHWDAASTNFVTRRVQFFDPSRRFEHVTFAPIDLPTQ
jgi:hypothetical protein